MLVGENHPRAILTDHEISLLRDLRLEGFGYKRLAKVFEISVRHVRDVVHDRRRVIR